MLCQNEMRDRTNNKKQCLISNGRFMFDAVYSKSNIHEHYIMEKIDKRLDYNTNP